MNTNISHIEKLISESRNFEAYHSIESLLNSSPGEERLEQLKALTLSKLGSPMNAMEYFEPLWRSHKNAAESAGIMGGIYKSLFVDTENPKYGKQSASTYLANFQETRDYYTGINAATMAKLTGDLQMAKNIANQLIESLILQERDFWQEATLAEAFLLIKDTDKATDHYIRAHELMGNNWGAIGSVQRQLWLLDHYIRVPKSIQRFFKPPVVAVFTGHMIDARDRATPRFKPEMEDAVRKAIRSSIQSLNIQIGYSSLANGSDILFVEEMLDLNREVEIYLPFKKEDFIQTSVAFAGDHWVERFEYLLNKVSKVEYLTENPFNGDDYNYHILAEFMSGAAMLRTKLMRSEPLLLTVLSEHSIEAKTGGARNLLNAWQEDTINRINIDIYKDSLSTVLPPNFERVEGIKKNNFSNLTRSFIIILEISDSNFDVHQTISNSSYAEALLTYKQVGSKEIIVFSNFSSLRNFIRDFMNSNAARAEFKGGIRSSYLPKIDESVLEMETIKDTMNFCDHSPYNTILVDQIVAFRMIFHSEDWDIVHSGEFKSQGKSENIYRLSKKEF